MNNKVFSSLHERLFVRNSNCFEKNIFFLAKNVMEEEMQLSPYQLSKPGVSLEQLITTYNEQKSKHSEEFNGFRELGKKIPECISKLPPRARPMLQDVVKLYDKVNYIMRIGLGKSSNLLMKFVVKGIQVYRYDQEADKKELVQITKKIDQRFIKELVKFADESKEKFFIIFDELLKMGGSDDFKNLLDEKEKLKSKLEDVSKNILDLNRKLRQEEGEVEYYNFEIVANSKDVEDRKVFKNNLEQQLADLYKQVPVFQQKLLETNATVSDTNVRSVFFLFSRREVHVKANPAHEAAQRNLDNLNNKIKALEETLKNWDSANKEKIAQFTGKLSAAKKNIEQYKDELKIANADRDKMMAELEVLIKRMEQEYNGSSHQNFEALKAVDNLATTINNGITFLTEDFSNIIIESDNVVESDINDKSSLSLSLPAALEIIGFADRYNNTRMIERLQNQIALVD